MQKILERHGKGQGIIQLLKAVSVHFTETVKDNNICRLFILTYQGIRLLHAGLPGIHRVDTVRFDLPEFFPADISG